MGDSIYSSARALVRPEGARGWWIPFFFWHQQQPCATVSLPQPALWFAPLSFLVFLRSWPKAQPPLINRSTLPPYQAHGFDIAGCIKPNYVKAIQHLERYLMDNTFDHTAKWLQAVLRQSTSVSNVEEVWHCNGRLQYCMQYRLCSHNIPSNGMFPAIDEA